MASQTSKKIREWHDTLKAGGSVRMYDDAAESALIIATNRFLNGLGPDRGDVLGEGAYAEVEAALGASEPPENERYAAARRMGMR